MGMYMYPIKIKRNAQKVNYEKEVELDRQGPLTLALLRKYVAENETFLAHLSNYNTYILNIYGTRMETEEEVRIRVGKEEKYMENYQKFQDTKKS
jgi:hypothetical protein